MAEIIFQFITYVLAIYGLINLVVNISGLFYKKSYSKDIKIKAVLFVKNCEDVIEGVIRNIFIGDFLRKVMSNRNLTVVDMGSTDRTLDILEIIERDYDAVEVLKESEKEKVFDFFDEIPEEK
ncbi:MAG TPA: hypothetical protein GXX14_01125 [Clostridiaceae bacterium]|nr:hypothetical protein [Clostridiaceae bacterium]